MGSKPKPEHPGTQLTPYLEAIMGLAAIPDLIPLVYHFNMNTRWDAQVALVRLTGENYGTDAQAWGKWYNANRRKLGRNLPLFNPTPVDWTCGSDNPELKKWADPSFQKEMDAKF